MRGREFITASTRYYLDDQRNGRPWITRLPFPVHVVERIETDDDISRNRFVSRFAYHHGYFDGVEREFRGFGRVEQVDVEDYGTFLAGNSASPYVTTDRTLYQPPIKTVTWYHTGAAVDHRRILSHSLPNTSRPAFPIRPSSPSGWSPSRTSPRMI